MNRKIICKLVVNGHDITKLTFIEIVNITGTSNSPEFSAYQYYQDNYYPTMLIDYITEKYGKQDIQIKCNKNTKYRKEVKEHPEWFLSLYEIREKKLKNILNEI